MEEIPGNTLEDLAGNKSLQHPSFAIYDFETMTIETDDQSKLEELCKNIDKSYTKKSQTYINRICTGCLLFSRWGQNAIQMQENRD